MVKKILKLPILRLYEDFFVLIEAKQFNFKNLSRHFNQFDKEIRK
jgi:hypothetical protein